MSFYWDTLQNIRWNYTINRWKNNYFKTCIDDAIIDNMLIVDNGLALEKAFNISIPLQYFDNNVHKSLYKDALDTFVYLNFCPKEVFDSPWTLLTQDILLNSTNSMMIIFLNRVRIQNEQPWAKFLLETVKKKFGMEYKIIDLMERLSIEGGSMTSFKGKKWNRVHELSNHPVHIKRSSGEASPSTFIPFCQFGGRSEGVGVIVDGFSSPVCSIFKAKVLNDQLCYEVDVNEFINKDTSEEDLKAGLTIFVDYNEDRQVSNTDNKSLFHDIKGLTK